MPTVTTTTIYNKLEGSLYIGYVCCYCNSPVVQSFDYRINTEYIDSIFGRSKKPEQVKESFELALNEVMNEIESIKSSKGDIKRLFTEFSRRYIRDIQTRIVLNRYGSCPFCESTQPWMDKEKDFSISMKEENYPELINRNMIEEWINTKITVQKNKVECIRKDPEALLDLLSQMRSTHEELLESIERVSNDEKTLKNERDQLLRQKKVNAKEKKELENKLNVLKMRYVYEYNKERKFSCLEHWRKVIENGYDGVHSIAKKGAVCSALAYPGEEIKGNGSLEELVNSVFALKDNTTAKLIGDLIDLLANDKSEINQVSSGKEQISTKTEKIQIGSTEIQSEAERAVFCHKCGKKLREGSCFCGKCGARIK